MTSLCVCDSCPVSQLPVRPSRPMCPKRATSLGPPRSDSRLLRLGRPSTSAVDSISPRTDLGASSPFAPLLPYPSGAALQRSTRREAQHRVVRAASDRQRYRCSESKNLGPHEGRGSHELLLVGVTGFEPATSSSRTTRATKLRHTPAARTQAGVQRRSRYPTADLATESVNSSAQVGSCGARRQSEQRGFGTAGQAERRVGGGA